MVGSYIWKIAVIFHIFLTFLEYELKKSILISIFKKMIILTGGYISPSDFLQTLEQLVAVQVQYDQRVKYIFSAHYVGISY